MLFELGGKRVTRGKSIITIAFILVLFLLVTGCAQAGGKQKEIKIGYQKGATLLTLKENETFINELEQEGYTVTWSEFNTGSSILEALNAGSIDLANAGDLPALFALAKGSDFQFIASEPDAPGTEGIIVHPDAGIERLEDLKGKRVAFNQASISQYLTIKALDTVDLTVDDIIPVHLDPSDASIAFEKGDVDAWVVWDPYMTVAENSGNTILQTAEDIVVYRSFYLSSPTMTKEHPEAVAIYLKYIQDIGNTINQDQTDAAELMEEVTKVPAATWEIALKRKSLQTEYMGEATVHDLEMQAEDLLEMGLIDTPISFEGKVWYPDEAEK